MNSGPMTADDFAARLLELGPGVAALVYEHRADYADEILLHLLMADVRRFAIATYYNCEDDDVVGALLRLVAIALDTGDDTVQNAVGISFVEDACAWQPRMAAFVATWPVALSAEVARQGRR